MAIGISPFHDLALLGSYLAWIVVGRGAAARRPDAATTELSVGSR